METEHLNPEELNDIPEDVEVEDDEDSYSPEDELWPEGPKMAQIDAWKQQYGKDSIYVSSFSATRHIVWRTLNRFEYRRLVKNLEQAVATGQVSQAEANMNNEEQIAEMCILYPPYSRAQSANEMAGVATVIASEVMEASAFVSVEVRRL